MRRGSVTPGMQFAFELIVYSLADMTYNILLSLASGYYSYEKLKKALEQRDINYREFIRLVMKYPIFSNNLLGLGLQNIVQVLSKNKQDQIISSIAENALGYDIRNIIRALQGFAAYAMGEVPKNSPIMATYNVFGRVIPVLNSTLVKMLLMQAFGDLNYSGRRTGSRSRSSYIIDKIHAVSDDSIRELAIRNMFKQGVYSPADKRNITGEYLSSQSMTPMIQESINEAKKLSKPKEIPNIPQVQPVKTQPRSTASLKELGSTPYAPPEGML
jgi:large-conductance mechanosensitive channel